MVSRERRLRSAVDYLMGLVLLAVASAAPASFAAAQDELTFFRIGTASTAGTYFPVGGVLANAISHPPGSRECERGGSCGVPGMIATVQSTEGSVDNVGLIARGAVESALVQADVAYWAHNGEGLFEESGPVDNIRTIANLYPEAIHLVVRADLGVRKIEDLEGLRISLDADGSGTRADALLILDAYGLSPEDIEISDVAAGEAADLMREGELDGFFFVAGTPARAIFNLAQQIPITLVPIDGEKAEALRARYPFFAEHSILAGTYRNVPQIDTLSVGAQWVVDARVDEDTVYQITRALWHPTSRKLLDNSHPKARQITLGTALNGVAVPLHPGARRYYMEIGQEVPVIPQHPDGEETGEGESGRAEDMAGENRDRKAREESLPRPAPAKPEPSGAEQ